jgi:hypothetical protein
VTVGHIKRPVLRGGQRSLSLGKDSEVKPHWVRLAVGTILALTALSRSGLTLT